MRVRSLTFTQKSLNSRAEDGAQNELHTLRIEKDATIGRRKKIDNSLRNVNQEIAKQVPDSPVLRTNFMPQSGYHRVCFAQFRLFQ